MSTTLPGAVSRWSSRRARPRSAFSPLVWYSSGPQASSTSAYFFVFQAEDGIRDLTVTGVQTCALPISLQAHRVTKAVRLRRLDEVLLVQRAVARRQTTLEEQFLPLLDHAVAEVVEHHHLQRQVVGGHGLQLPDVHADAGIPVDVDHQAPGLGDLRPDGRRQPETHGAHAAGGEPQPRCGEIAVLCRPHLVLADAGGDDGLPARAAGGLLDDVVGLDQGTRAVVVRSEERRVGEECRSRWSPD